MFALISFVFWPQVWMAKSKGLKKKLLFYVLYLTLNCIIYFLVREKEGKLEHTIKSITMFLKFVKLSF